MALLPLPTHKDPFFQSQNASLPSSHVLYSLKPLFLQHKNLRFSQNLFTISAFKNLSPFSQPKTFSKVPPSRSETLKVHPALLQFAASAIIFVGFAARACAGNPGQIPTVTATVSTAVQEEKIGEKAHVGNDSVESNSDNHGVGKSDVLGNIQDEKLKAALESWKSKTYALTVPLRVVALRGSVPPSWLKEFMRAQGRRSNLRLEFRGNLVDIFSDLSVASTKGNLELKSAMAADIITVGDSWLSLAIKKGLIEPIKDIEGQDCFKCLSDKWKVYLRRNNNGELYSRGEIWAVPYRWGSMVIAYKKSKFQKHNLAPIEDWRDLWRPELAGKISMVDSPREVVGAVLKYMGASYNTKDIESQVSGGRKTVMQNLAVLQKQVRLFDSAYYLKAFGVGDVWVAVGWSSDILPAAKRMSNVAVIVPKSGASLWADLWAIPSASRFSTNRIGGRVRGPSPLIYQWMEFCLQVARALPFKQEVVPGASPFTPEEPSVEASLESTRRRPKLETNLIAGVPPPEILSRCEFLEPLTEATLSDYQWLIASMKKPAHGVKETLQHYISSMTNSFGWKPEET
ncbi:spermidine-binding periplasmic protein SpuE isoform X2 [Macadamia integrifolia]|uniref:spermidine-binding periplasmic protein SpuE isoform X2 n=1 Tax=Macadamia integrifolia TaxID=60698 RepID=UPI001C4F304B|nr:spermidine-binding periplasmic protein SpuE isoform X2 [Macadamia integrifolia]